ncbi:MAG: helix-turn-helix domain-containing protein [Candidatus Methylomirabilia bacterium]
MGRLAFEQSPLQERLEIATAVGDQENVAVPAHDPAWSPGDRLTWIRRYFGLSQEAMARRLRVDPGTLARWERGKRELNGRSPSSPGEDYRRQCPRVAKHPQGSPSEKPDKLLNTYSGLPDNCP